MTNWWQQPRAAALIQQYLNLNPRERWLTLITLSLLLLVLGSWLLAEPLWRDGWQRQQQAQQRQQENQQLQQRLTQLQNTPVVDPNQVLRDELELLRSEHQAIEQRIASLTDALVSPQQMVVVLEQMLTQDSRLKITGLVTLPREEILLGEDEPQARLYKHRLRITLSASYPALLAYLQRLDTLKWRLYWQLLDYQVEQYPRGEVTLEVYTLSSREDVLGG